MLEDEMWVWMGWAFLSADKRKLERILGAEGMAHR
jgi:hypothetical protein